MDQVEITLQRALKIWWSFTWRSMLLFLAVMVPLEIILFVFLFRNFPPHGQQPGPGRAVKYGLLMLVAWPALMAVMIALQAQGMRWMLKSAQWSDFRVTLQPKN
jgi:hypothetical protein